MRHMYIYMRARALVRVCNCQYIKNPKMGDRLTLFDFTNNED